jgi:uncharacterized membrane protein YqaE (UPF0057 family)
MIMLFLFFSLFMCYIIFIDLLCWAYMYVEYETKLMMTFDLFYVLLNSGCKDFVKDILMCVHQWIWCLIFFFYPVCIWVVYQNNSDFIEYV